MLTETLLRITFSMTGQCSLVPTSHCLQGKRARVNLSQAASGMILQNHRWLPVSIFSVKIAALGFLKWVTGRIFNMFKFSKGQAKTLSFIFSSPKNLKNCINYQCMYRKYLFNITSLQRYSSRDAIPLKCRRGPILEILCVHCNNNKNSLPYRTMQKCPFSA